MEGNILVINAGSSSIKFSIFSIDANPLDLNLLSHGQIESIGTEDARFRAKDGQGSVLIDETLNGHGHSVDHDQALTALITWLEGRASNKMIIGTGHRIVHGGSQYHRPQVFDAELMADLEALIPLAPLHQPHNLHAVKVLAKLRPDIPQVACFDTGFHHDQTPLVRMYALPEKIRRAGVQRYGFHGLSYEYIASVLPEELPDQADGRIIVAHLGNGASLCAMHQRKSVATTMGFTALEGLPMGTRSGAIDPGVILYLLDELKMTTKEVAQLLYKESGLRGVSGDSSDMRELLASDTPQAALAIDLFVYRIVREIGSLVAALGGLDALIFTAGIGENAAAIRSRVCGDLNWLGVQIDEDSNQRKNSMINSPQSAVKVAIIPTNEELMIARHTFDQLKSQKPV